MAHQKSWRYRLRKTFQPIGRIFAKRKSPFSMSIIRKSSNPADIHTYDKEYWWAKTPQERMAAALKLIRRAKAIYYANPANPPLGNGGRVLKSDKPITHPRLPNILPQDLLDLENLPNPEQ